MKIPMYTLAYGNDRTTDKKLRYKNHKHITTMQRKILQLFPSTSRCISGKN